MDVVHGVEVGLGMLHVSIQKSLSVENGADRETPAVLIFINMMKYPLKYYCHTSVVSFFVLCEDRVRAK